MDMNTAYVRIDTEPLGNVLTELAAEIPAELVDSTVSLTNSLDKLVCFEYGDTTRANELTVTLQPSDALLRLTATMRTR